MSHLAYLTNRSYVFEDYTWSHSPLPYALYDFALRPTRIPLNAFIAGPSAGGPMPDHSPRAVSTEYWDAVCGDAEDVVVVSSRDARTDTEGSEMMRWWVEKLEEDEYRNARCLSVDSTDKDVFDRFLFGDKRMLSLWPSLSTSPILTGFAWSDLVISAIYRNFPLLRSYPSSPNTNSKALTSSPSSSSSSSSSISDPSHRTPNLPGVLAIHLRRGDYIRHCPNLDSWNAIYMGWAQFPTLPSSDRFDPFVFPSGSPERRAYYMEHCLPTIEQTVQRLHVIREEHAATVGREMRRVYVMTNEWAGSVWLEGLRDKLREDGWEDVMGSAGLVLDREQRYVSGAVDMGIAERAEVFVGNGFSSMSANIVMLRMANGLDPLTNRFL
ncbi:uncharacterized protein STEHIDRAFT_100601 [Stereum hirsutum FP-91666 SS1]|uniref:uncharacterized protein n=1 Tax=Stereum hirsutum (strain FP-91666) TaxID=721885 RepID=UPI000444949A|nr:uncharacterized protein STEHIDRAFT_100601 [Stereum hirsutum FP-91666 SS1]EIM84587.1 hypothetical protein STEHIDRAFT_100601 [Stereum hirsutum FP-91666 SS1]